MRRSGRSRGQPWPMLCAAVLVVSGRPIAAAVGIADGPRSFRQQSDAKTLFAQRCAACHGQAGAGDGPAASALTPRPTNFADTVFQAARTDQQLTAVITEGKLPMPAFRDQLSATQIKALVDYIRQLGRGRGRQRP